MRNALTLLLLALTTGFAVFQYGGVTAAEWNLVLIAICLLSVSFWLRGPAAAFAPALSPAAAALAAAIPAYVVLQLIPLPANWLSFLSPARREILLALAPMRVHNWAPLSVSSALTFAHLLRLLVYLLVFLLIRELSFRLADRVWLVALPLLAIASLESALGLIQHFEAGGSARGTYVNPDHFAGLLEMAFPLAVAFVLILINAARLATAESIKSAILICLLLACMALITLALVYSNSRMSIAVTAVSMSVLGLLGIRSARAGSSLIAAAAGLALVLIAAPLSLVGRYATGLSSEARLQIWKDTLPLIASYPVFGCGLGTYASAIQKFRSSTPLALVDYAHNDYLQLLSELGAVGFLIVVAAGFLLLKSVLAIARAELNQSRRLIATACAASLAGMAVHSLVEFQFYIPANVMIAAWMAGIASGIGARTALLGQPLPATPASRSGNLLLPDYSARPSQSHPDPRPAAS
jgi:O-antigen ligase